MSRYNTAKGATSEQEMDRI